jgi:hypothetical protein
MADCCERKNFIKTKYFIHHLNFLFIMNTKKVLLAIAVMSMAISGLSAQKFKPVPVFFERTD